MRKTKGSSKSRMLAFSLISVGLGSCLLLAIPEPSPSDEMTNYVPNEVVVTFAEMYVPAQDSVSFPAASVGISAVDSLFDASSALFLSKVIPSYDVYTSEAGRRLERTFVVHLSGSPDIPELVEAWALLPYFEHVEVNALLDWETAGTSRFTPDEGTAFEDQWNLDNSDAGDSSDIDMPEAWAIERGNPELVISIFDKGAMVDTSTFDYGWRLHSDFNYHWIAAEDVGSPGVINAADLDGVDSNSDQVGTHPYAYKSNIIGFSIAKGFDADDSIDAEEKKRFWYGIPHSWQPNVYDPVNCGCGDHDPDCPCPNSWTVVDYDQHGVIVASIAGARLDYDKPDGPDIVGVAHNCKVYFGRFDSQQSSVDMARAIEHQSRIARVVNMSFGGPTQSAFVRDAVTVATRENDCVLVAATGNDDPQVNYPARYDSVLAVGAIRRAPLVLTTYSNWTTTGEVVDVVAPVDAGIPADSYSDCPSTYPCAIAEEFVESSSTGTSFAAPQASGLAALVRSRFPGLNQFDVKQRIKRGAQFYWDENSTTDRRKYGAGKINAYRTLSESGSIHVNTTWKPNTLAPVFQGGAWVSRPGSRDGIYYVSGDLTVEEGATLTIEAGTVVRVAEDHDGTGTDPSRSQIIVRGTLNILGSLTDPVVLEGFSDAALTNNEWAGIQFEEGSSGSISHAVIRNAVKAVKTYVPLVVENVRIEDGSTGGIHAFDGLEISDSQFEDVQYPAIKVEGGTLDADNVEVSACSYGIVGNQDFGAATIVGCTFRDIEYRAIELSSDSGDLLIEGVSFENCYEAIFLSDYTAAEIADCTVRKSDIGIWLANSSGILVSSSRIDSCETAGIYSVLSSATIETDSVSNSTIGVLFDFYSSGVVSEGCLLSNNSAGIKCDHNSNPVVRNTRITENVSGVISIDSAPDLGIATGGSGCGATGPGIGNNSIHNNSAYHVANLSVGETVMAEGNWWQTNPPKTSKFLGNVVRDPWQCADPNPVATMADIDDRRPGGDRGEGLPRQYYLEANWPNPFNPETTMSFGVPSPGGIVEIAVFDVRGALVNTLVRGHRSPGVHTATWSGRNNTGDPVASGVYLVRMLASSFEATHKVVLLK